MATEPLPYYRWHWRDFRASRKVQRMTYIERGLYRELLDECWAVGYIPNDISELADICGCPEQVLTSAWQVLSKCFIERDGVLINEKLDSVRTETDKTRASRAAAGKASAMARINQPTSVEQVLTSAEQMPANVNKCHIALAEQSNSKAVAEQEHNAHARHVSIAKHLRSLGCMKVHSGLPILIQWANTGYSDQELAAAVSLAESRGKPAGTLSPNYLDPILAGNRSSATNSIRAGPSLEEKNQENMRKWLNGD